jgi:hypothetical protein
MNYARTIQRNIIRKQVGKNKNMREHWRNIIARRLGGVVNYIINYNRTAGRKF